MHLTEDQFFSFRLGAPKYEWFFSTGSSNSARVTVGILRCDAVQAKSVSHIARHLLVLDLWAQGDSFRLLYIYAPNDLWLCHEFFDETHPFVIPGCTVLLGDFNTVLGCCDRLSGKLDSTSGLLGDLVTFASSSEPMGHVQFTYQHPSVCQRH